MRIAACQTHTIHDFRYCAHYVDMDSVEDNPPLAGIPMNCYDECMWDDSMHSCIYDTNYPGEYRYEGCLVKGSNQTQCYTGVSEDCRSRLLVTLGVDGDVTTMEALRGADRTSEPIRVG